MNSWKLQFPQEFERTLEAWSSEIGNAISSFRKAIDEPRKMVQRFAEQNAELLEALRSFDVVLPALVEDMLSPMVSVGWYPDLEMPFANLADVVDLFKTDPVSAESQYAAYFTVELPAAEDRLVLSCPSRKELYSDGFVAHRQGLYFSSVPVFLAQAEGLAQERLGALLYSRKKLRKRVAELAKENWTFSDVLMRPLVEPTDINKTTTERPRGFSGLNRHSVLHGEDIAYGTEQNSLKAISHLLFVSDVLKSVADPP